MNNAINVHKLEEASLALKTIVESLDYQFQLRLKKQVSYQLIYFENLLDQVTLNLNHIIRAKQAKILYDFSSCPQILFPHAHLESLFHQLISHAMQYDYPGKTPIIKISSNYNQGSIWLSFQDNSIGLDLEKYSHEPCTLGQASIPIHISLPQGQLKTISPSEVLGGSIYLESKVGQGSIFVVEFDKQPPAGKLD